MLECFKPNEVLIIRILLDLFHNPPIRESHPLLNDERTKNHPAGFCNVSCCRCEYSRILRLPYPWQYVLTEKGKKQFFTLKELMNAPQVESIVCATDAGREGELIFRLVYSQCGCHKPVKRLWISSLEETAIREGFQHLHDSSEYDRLYEAALCRQKADWLVGINASRLYSLIYGTTLNIGRVMTPTLNMLRQREQAIEAFQPEKYHTVQISCGFLASGERISDPEEAKKIAASCSMKAAYVRKVDRKQKKENPPRLYDLTTL